MTRLSDERLAQIRTMHRGSGFAFPAMAISDLLDHIDALEEERAERENEWEIFTNGAPVQETDR